MLASKGSIIIFIPFFSNLKTAVRICLDFLENWIYFPPPLSLSLSLYIYIYIYIYIYTVNMYNSTAFLWNHTSSIPEKSCIYIEKFTKIIFLSLKSYHVFVLDGNINRNKTDSIFLYYTCNTCNLNIYLDFIFPLICSKVI